MNERARVFRNAMLAFMGVHAPFFHASAAEVAVPQCPEGLTAKQEIILPVAEGWKTVDSSRSHLLGGIAFSDSEYGKVQPGLLIPSGSEDLPGGGNMIYYDLGPDANGLHDSWVVCKYRRTAVVLIRKLPENVMRCEVMRPYPYFLSHDDNTPGKPTMRCFDQPPPNAEKQ
jgi:hypothetical protein